jgi:hypothetical protein
LGGGAVLSKPKLGRHQRSRQNFSATLPLGMHQAFKDLAARMREARGVPLGNPIYVQDLYDEGIVHLAKAIETGEEVHFLPVPRDLSERKTCIVSKRTYAVAQKLAKRQNVKISAVALTGFSRYLQKYGPDFYDKIKAAANRKRR